VSPVRYELGFYIPEDDILHSHCRENLKSYYQKFNSGRTFPCRLTAMGSQRRERESSGAVKFCHVWPRQIALRTSQICAQPHVTCPQMRFLSNFATPPKLLPNNSSYTVYNLRRMLSSVMVRRVALEGKTFREERSASIIGVTRIS
jgi:hypothetical protein